jgi:hypothetical protein
MFSNMWPNVATPLLEECEDDTPTPEMGTWESSGTLETSKFDCKGQNTSPWGVLHAIGKLLKFRCRKWPRMSHLDICNTSYSKNKDQESNWQFDSWPLKVGNRPKPGVRRWSVTHRWKSSQGNLQVCFRPYPNRRSKQIIMNSQSPESPNRDNFRTPPWESQDKKPFRCGCRKITQRILYGEGGGFPQIWAVVNLVSPELPVACPSTKGALECELTNLLVGLMQVRVSN